MPLNTMKTSFLLLPCIMMFFVTSTASAFCPAKLVTVTTGHALHQQPPKATEDFWLQQKELAQKMSTSAQKSLKQEQLEKYQKRLLALVSDTAFYSVLIFCMIWSLGDNPLTAASYAFGTLFGTAYSFGLGKFVETLGGSAEEAGDVQGAGVGQARFAFLILLFIVVGRFRSQGLQEIPAIAGFFTYQIASLSQGLKEYND